MSPGLALDHSDESWKTKREKKEGAERVICGFELALGPSQLKGQRP